MRIYSDRLHTDDLYSACGDNQIKITAARMPRCRLRTAGWVVTSYWPSGMRPKNSGDCGAVPQSEWRAASWDAHGWWMAAIFARDPDALIVASVRYDGEDDFHTKTGGKYRSKAAAFLRGEGGA